MQQKQTFHAGWTADPAVRLATLQITIFNPRGESAAQQRLDYAFPVVSGQDIKDMTVPGVKP